MSRAGRPTVTWKSVQTDPIYRTIWDQLRTGPKFFSQLRAVMEGKTEAAQPRVKDAARPGTLLKRLRKLESLGLVRFERDPEVIGRWVKVKLVTPESDQRLGRPSQGVWCTDSSQAVAVRVAEAHSQVLARTPAREMTLERIGNGVDLLVAGTKGDDARWWYEQSPQVKIGRLFWCLDILTRELAKTLLSANPEAVRAQERLREAVARDRRNSSIHPGRGVPSSPATLAARENANRFQLLVSLRVLPAYWYDETDKPIELVSEVEQVLQRINGLTTGRKLPITFLTAEGEEKYVRGSGSKVELTVNRAPGPWKVIPVTDADLDRIRPPPVRPKQREGRKAAQPILLESRTPNSTEHACARMSR